MKLNVALCSKHVALCCSHVELQNVVSVECGELPIKCQQTLRTLHCVLRFVLSETNNALSETNVALSETNVGLSTKHVALCTLSVLSEKYETPMLHARFEFCQEYNAIKKWYGGAS